MDSFLHKLLCGFKKAHSTLHALFKLSHNCQKELDNSGFFGTVFIGLSKAYDCLPHDLTIANFEASSLSKSSLKLLKSLFKITKTTCENRVFFTASGLI